VEELIFHDYRIITNTGKARRKGIRLDECSLVKKQIAITAY
jgi:hypothetical protein